MIFGVGVDIVATRRISAALARHGESFARKILSEAESGEFATVKQPETFLAKRFAAKEALSKALGTGLRGPVTLRNISVAHDELGRPAFRFAPALQAWVEGQGIQCCHLSISDETDNACAFVVVER